MDLFPIKTDKPSKASDKKKVSRKEYIKSLKEENTEIKKMIAKIQQDITAVEAQNRILLQQLQFFQNNYSIFHSTGSNDTKKDDNEQKSPHNSNSTTNAPDSASQHSSDTDTKSKTSRSDSDTLDLNILSDIF